MNSTSPQSNMLEFFAEIDQIIEDEVQAQLEPFREEVSTMGKLLQLHTEINNFYAQHVNDQKLEIEKQKEENKVLRNDLLATKREVVILSVQNEENKKMIETLNRKFKEFVLKFQLES